MSVILVKSENLLALVYHNAAITASVGLLWPLALVYIMEGATVVVGMILLAEVRVRAIFLTRTIERARFRALRGRACPSDGNCRSCVGKWWYQL